MKSLREELSVSLFNPLCHLARGLQRLYSKRNLVYGTLYAGVDYITSPYADFRSRLQHIYHGHPYVRDDLHPMPEFTLAHRVRF
jgi:hypothetical protein